MCCPTTCGTCAGTGCSGRPGGSSQCCGGGIKASQILCEDGVSAPCIIDESLIVPPTPSPTPTSVESSSPTPVMTIPTSCDSGNVPTFRYASTSGKVGKGRLCESLPLTQQRVSRLTPRHPQLLRNNAEFLSHRVWLLQPNPVCVRFGSSFRLHTADPASPPADAGQFASEPFASRFTLFRFLLTRVQATADASPRQHTQNR